MTVAIPAFLSIVLLLLILWAVFGKGRRHPRIGRHPLEDAVLCLLENRHEDALVALDASLKRSRNADFPYFLYGVALSRVGKSVQAARMFEFLIADPMVEADIREKARRYAAELAFQNRDFGKARQLFAELFKYSQDEHLIKRLAECARQVRDFEAAAKAFAKLPENEASKQQRSSLAVARAKEAWKSGDKKEAARRCKEALDLNPVSADAFMTLISNHLEEQDWEKCVNAIIGLLKARPDFIFAVYHHLENAFFQIGDVYKVGTALESALSKRESDKYLLLYLGEFAKKHRDFSGAQRYLEQALDHDHGFAEARVALLKAQSENSHFEAVARDLPKLLEETCASHSQFICRTCKTEFSRLATCCPHCLGENTVQHRRFDLSEEN